MHTSDIFYRKAFTVPDFECDINNHMKLSYLLRHLQDVSTSQLDEMGLGYHRLFQEGTVFLLSKIGVQINRMPTAGENVVFRTAPQGVKGAQFRRESYLESATGEVLAMAQSIWFVVNPTTWKIVRPSAFAHALPAVPEEERMANIGVDRVRPEGSVVLTGEKRVLYSDMDLNQHLNNTVYADIITDHIPFDVIKSQILSRVFIHYHNQAVWNDTVAVTTTQAENGWYYITGMLGEEKCFEAKVLFQSH